LLGKKNRGKHLRGCSGKRRKEGQVSFVEGSSEVRREVIVWDYEKAAESKKVGGKKTGRRAERPKKGIKREFDVLEVQKRGGGVVEKNDPGG